MYGSWFLTTFGGALVIVAVVAIFASAWTPIFAVFFCLLVLGFAIAAVIVRRSARAGQGATAEGSGDAMRGVASPAPRPRSGGAPASGEGAASGGEAATPRR
jgi:hypothetical protein